MSVPVVETPDYYRRILDAMDMAIERIKLRDAMVVLLYARVLPVWSPLLAALRHEHDDLVDELDAMLYRVRCKLAQDS